MSSATSRQTTTAAPRHERPQYDGQVAAQALDLLRKEKMSRKVSGISAA